MKDFAKSIMTGNAYQYAGNIPIEKIPDNWRPEFPKAGYVVYYAPNKAKWFATEAEAKRFAESQDKAQKNGNAKFGNSKVGNASTFDRLDDAVHYASNLTDEALRRLNGTFSATNLISALSKCKQACDDAIKLTQQYDREINK